MKKFIFSFVLVLVSTVVKASSPRIIEGADLQTGATIKVTSEQKNLVVLFLSATCPCSNSHVKELKALAHDYPDFNFVAVHSNSNETKAETQTYFKQAALPFPVIQDHKVKIADELKASKTPHAFVFLKDGSIAYQGGVSDSHEFENSKHQFLRDALSDLTGPTHKVRVASGRTLGCTISRGETYVW